MDITFVALRPERHAHIRARGYLILAGAWRINDVQVVQERDGRLHVRLPRRYFADGEAAYDIVHPISQRAREALEAAVLAEFQTLTARRAE